VQSTDFQDELRAAQAGDERAFASLFRAVQPVLLRYLGGLTYNLADGTAEDVAADTWVQVVRGIGRFRGDEQSFRAWVFTIARARLVDARRRSGRLPVPEDVEQRLADVALPSAEDSVEVLFTTERALALVGSLPAAQAEVVLLRYVAGFDVRETGRILGRREGAVRVTAHRALRKLEEMLDGSVDRPGVTRTRSDSVKEVT
jgi:RNA polymerase sigma-70 factor, ECF subfamily